MPIPYQITFVSNRQNHLVCDDVFRLWLAFVDSVLGGGKDMIVFVGYVHKLVGVVWFAIPVDLKTGKPKEDGHLLGPKDIWAGMEPVFGIPMERHFDASAKPIKFL